VIGPTWNFESDGHHDVDDGEGGAASLSSSAPRRSTSGFDLRMPAQMMMTTDRFSDERLPVGDGDVEPVRVSFRKASRRDRSRCGPIVVSWRCGT